jgi:ribosomal protein L7/L12
MWSRLRIHVLKTFLVVLEQLFALTRAKSPPPYPYDAHTNRINVPETIDKELRQLIATGNKVEAVKRVTKLTGAGLRVSKDYIDTLAATRHTHRST